MLKLIMTDEYILYIEKDGHHFYHKNGKLHREAGPAYFPSIYKEQYTNLCDEELYKKVLIYTINVKQYRVHMNNDPNDLLVKYRPLTANYHLDGKQYDEKEFVIIKLNNELSRELNTNQLNTKKTKL